MAPDSIPQIEPPEGSNWQPHSPHGLQRFKDGPGGNVVRLADVVRWLMSARHLPLLDAVDRVCSQLEGDSPPLVYLLDANRWARAQDEFSDWAVFYFDEYSGLADLPPPIAHAKAAGRSLRASWLIEPHVLARLVNEPGRRAEYNSDKQTPFEWSESGKRGSAWAVPFAVAHALWGWGSVNAGAMGKAAGPAGLGADDVKDYATLCQFMVRHKGKEGHERPAWRAEWVAWARAEVKVRGRGARAAVAREMGISSQALAQVFQRHPEPKASPFDALTNRAA
ncbi:MAG: hypothetical protein LWW96_14000 [Acidovorax sp.]|uniref:hypothetical protein n=1 Tax=Acidovorax sp. TaxID=1872122 RepID=UPI0025BB6F29|nr:hypothetical protein [Acidovorax sp.]MCE1193255.1 hypothetical protein [Acidovorax sp.]